MRALSLGKLAAFLVFLTAFQAVMLFWHGVLMITVHEGDAMHTAQILLRMELGQLPHLDFLTPIGILAFAPISAFIGLGLGKAYLAGNVLMATLAIPGMLWVGKSRLSVGQAYGFGAGMILLLTAMVHGDILQVTSISMYYNRWSWAACFIAVALIVLPPKHQKSQVIDGLILGAVLSFLALSKATYFIALFPAVTGAILMRKQWQTLGVCLLVGILFIVAVTLGVGDVNFWGAYVNDLLVVSGGEIRNYPSHPLTDLLAGPSFILLNFILLLGVVLVRQSGQMVEGLILMLLAPAFIYITYQNWGNDPQWLFIFGILLLALRPDRPTMNPWGWDVRVALGSAGVLALALVTPAALNVAFSAVSHARLSPAEFSVFLKDEKHNSFVVETRRLYAPKSLAEITIPDERLAALGTNSANRKTHILFGETLKECSLHRGLGGMMQYIAQDMDKLGLAQGDTVLVADLLSNLWMFGSTVPITNGTPWYYGGDIGLRSADYLMVPFCPSTVTVWELTLAALAKEDAPEFIKVHQSDFYTLYQRQPDS